MIANKIVRHKTLPHLLLLIFYCSTLYGHIDLTYTLTSESDENNKTTYHVVLETTDTTIFTEKTSTGSTPAKSITKFDLTDILPCPEDMNVIFILKYVLKSTQEKIKLPLHQIIAIQGNTLFAFPLANKIDHLPEITTPLASATDIKNENRKLLFNKLKKGFTPSEATICTVKEMLEKNPKTHTDCRFTNTKPAIKSFTRASLHAAKNGFFNTEDDLFISFLFQESAWFKKDKPQYINGVVRNYICPSPPEDLSNHYLNVKQMKNWDSQSVNLAQFVILKFSDHFSRLLSGVYSTGDQWPDSAVDSNHVLYAFSLEQQTPAKELTKHLTRYTGCPTTTWLVFNRREPKNQVPNIESQSDFPPLSKTAQ